MVLSFIKRNWPIWTIGSVALLITAGALMWWVWLPGKLESLVTRVEGSVEKLTGAPMTHQKLELHGLERLTMEGVVFGAAESPLFKASRIDVDIDPWAYDDGLPLVLAVRLDGVELMAVRNADGTDNVTPIVKTVIEKLSQKGDGGPPGLLSRLIRMSPRIIMENVSVQVVQLPDADADSKAEPQEIVHFINGKVDIYNPGLAKSERKLQLDAGFESLTGESKARFAMDIDLSKRGVQALAEFTPPLPIRALGHSVDVEKVQFKKDEFVEVVLSKAVLENPMSTPERFRSVLLKAAGAAGVAGAEALVDRALNPQNEVAALMAPLKQRMASMKYPPETYQRLQSDVEHLVTSIARRLPQEAEFETIEFDGVRMLLTESRTPSGYLGRKLRLSVSSGGPLLEASADWVEEAETGRVDFDVTSPGRLLQARGFAARDGEKSSLEANIEWSMDEPHLQLSATVAYDGRWNASVKGQLRSERPAMALSGTATLKGKAVTVQAEGKLDLPGLAVGTFAGNYSGKAWNVDFKGDVVPPAGGGTWSVDAALDSSTLLRRLLLEAEGGVVLPVGPYDLRFNKARLGRDSVLHIENVALAPKGANPERALLRIADIALTMTDGSLGALPGHISEAQSGGDLKSLLGRVLKKVEVVEPVLVLTQPPKLPTASRPGSGDDNTAQDKLLDALEEERKSKKVVMNESIRKFLHSAVTRTDKGVRSLVSHFISFGDMFPIDEVVIKEGRFEYTDAVSPQDRLLNELSHFNATVLKEKRPGLGGKFSIEASFVMPSSDMGSGATLKANVDLATGNMSGDFTVDKLALYPYRFFFPSIVVPDRLSMLKGAHLGFNYVTETGRFTLWGGGQVSGISLVSARISEKPIDNLDFVISIGESAEAGLTFDLNQQRLFTDTPLLAKFGKIPAASMEFSVDAAVPDYPKFQWRLSVPPLPVDDLLDSVPLPLRATLNGMKVDGTLGFSVGISGDSANLNDLTFAFNGGDTPVAVSTPAPNADYHRLTGSFVHRPFTAKGRKINIGQGPNYWPIERISPWLVLAVTTTEDGGFFRHSGFNTLQIKNSIAANLEEARFVRGASTITMQLMKNLFLSHEKTLARKFQEIILTWLAERELGKEKIIEVYLNIIEWGNGVYGIKEACDHYFNGLPPEQISAAQAAFLASFIPYPRPFDSKWSGGFNGKRTKSWERWWNRRLKTVQRVVRAMELNCSTIESRCPSSIDYCSALRRICVDPAGEFEQVKEIKSLDELFRPQEGAGPGLLPTDVDDTGTADGDEDML